MLLVTACALSANGAAAQDYVYERLGLTGPGYTDQWGRTGSGVAWMNAINASGQVGGESALFSPDGTVFLGVEAWIYSQGVTRPIGLVGAEYTYPDGSRDSRAHHMNDAGVVIGQSSRYVGSSVDEAFSKAGQASWIFEHGVTQRIGLVGEGFTRSDGFARSEVSRLNQAGDVIGGTNRFLADSEAGYAAWLYRQGTTQQIGLLGSGFVRADGWAFSSAQMLNEAGQVLGNSSRYSGNLHTGNAIWIHSEGQTRQIGLTGTGYTRRDGWAYSSAERLNQAGQVVGHSERFNGNTHAGQAAWIFSEGQTRQIGLTGEGYTTRSGYAFSEVKAGNYNAPLNEAGQAIGYSTRYRTTIAGTQPQPNGQAAWLYSQGSTQKIGLTGNGFTQRVTGREYSDPIALNANGQVIGITERTGSGRAAWIHSDGSTREIGLTGAGYTDVISGDSTPKVLNDAGQVAGTSLRYIDSRRTGQDAWLYSEGVTRKIGVSDAFYTRSEVVWLNQAGQVIGQSQRASFDVFGGYVGHTVGWFYDDDLDQTFALDFDSPTADVGYFNSKVLGLTNDGLVIGTFEVHSGVDDWATDVLVGTRTFVWSMQRGMLDLSALTGEQPDPYHLDWSYLANSLHINEAGQIAGNGGQGAFLLTPVPEPESWALLLAGLGLTTRLAARRRRQAAPAVAV